jgi:isochorismate pyruvate lyase
MTTHPLAARLLAAVEPRPAPADCTSMEEVRNGVDALDRALVTLLAERQAYMHAAARIKPNRGAVRDEARIEDVVSKVLAEARFAGLSSAIAEPVWRTLIERCIAHEFEVWDRERG